MSLFGGSCLSRISNAIGQYRLLNYLSVNSHHYGDVRQQTQKVIPADASHLVLLGQARATSCIQDEAELHKRLVHVLCCLGVG